MNYHVQPGGALIGDIRVPGDKSISHRALMLGAIAEGKSRLEGLLESADCLSTLHALESMGVHFERLGAGVYEIEGVGLRGLSAPQKPLYLGNSGTGMRLLSGILAGQDFPVTLLGDASLSRRPMERIAVPLRLMGAKVQTSLKGTPPLEIQGSSYLKGIHHELTIPSAQVKSCLLLAGLYCDSEMVISGDQFTRDHTERLLESFSCPIDTKRNAIKLVGHRQLKTADIQIPGDFSSAAFFITAASLAPRSLLYIRDVGVNPTRIGLIHILRKMGANIQILNKKYWGKEEVADILVKYTPLKACPIPRAWIQMAIDEVPILCIAAACAIGVSKIRGAADLKNKESDRIAVMVANLNTMGIEAIAHPDGIDIRGAYLQGGVLESGFDHRVAMSLTMGGHFAKNEVIIRGCENVLTSFPNFITTAKQVGLAVEEVQTNND